MVEIKTLDPKTLKSWLDKNEAILIDVREPSEYKEAHIEKVVAVYQDILKYVLEDYETYHLTCFVLEL